MVKPVQASSYTFRTIIEGNFLYVDKTRFLYELVRPATGIYFLARPRRFGKSLTISTLEEIFAGNRALFQGLAIDQSDYNWESYPVIRLDFGRHSVKSAAALEQLLDYFLEELALRHEIVLRGFDYQTRFDNLIQQLAQKGKKVVILIDEYDKPITDNLEQITEATAIRDTLRNFYGVIKASDRYLRFVFITGISKFSKVGIFSALNNLDDISMAPQFATAFGITEEELQSYFQEHIADFAAQSGMSPDALLQQIRRWYNGFCFVENAPRVYNPFSTLQLFTRRRFSNYWFETGTPTFLIKLLKAQQFDIAELNDLRLRELGFSTYELESLSVVPLLFQTGYLTIKDYEAARRVYTLAYPNMEVEDAFLTFLLGDFSERDRSRNEDYLWRLIDAIEADDLERFFAILQVFFANVPYNIQLKHEKYYQSIFYLIFKLLGLRIEAEVHTNQGRIDAVVEVAERIYLFEFKIDGSAAAALTQIAEKDYFQKYRLQPKSITLVGANFDSPQRKVTEWESQAVAQ